MRHALDTIRAGREAVGDGGDLRVASSSVSTRRRDPRSTRRARVREHELHKMLCAFAWHAQDGFHLGPDGLRPAYARPRREACFAEAVSRREVNPSQESFVHSFGILTLGRPMGGGTPRSSPYCMQGRFVAPRLSGLTRRLRRRDRSLAGEGQGNKERLVYLSNGGAPRCFKPARSPWRGVGRAHSSVLKGGKIVGVGMDDQSSPTRAPPPLSGRRAAVLAQTTSGARL